MSPAVRGYPECSGPRRSSAATRSSHSKSRRSSIGRSSSCVSARPAGHVRASRSQTGRSWARSTCSLRYGSAPTEGSTSSAQTSKREQASPGTRSAPHSGGFEEDRQMEALREMRCVACRSDAPTLTEAEIAELHPQVSEWEIVEQDGVKKLTRVFRFDDFAKALAFTNALGE